MGMGAYIQDSYLLVVDDGDNSINPDEKVSAVLKCVN
jgi:hypothetical protein